MMESRRTQIDNAFEFSRPYASSDTIEIRSAARTLAYLIIESSPASREQSLALTNLEQAVMWAYEAIARNET